MTTNIDTLRKRHVVVNPETGCWEWNGPTDHGGYAMAYWRGRSSRSGHRVFYEELVGPIPEGFQIDHLCFVRNCVNPAHLEPVTAAENCRRAATRQTHCAQGHSFIEHGGRNSRGHRFCRVCDRRTSREYQRRRRAMESAAT